MSRIAFRNFSGGEVTPSISARYDLQKAGTFLMACENFLPTPHGAVERRPGTRFLADLGEASVLLPFQFNTEPDNNYVLVFGRERLRIFDTEGVQIGAEIQSPYMPEEVFSISYAQSGDILYLAHKDHPLRKIIRSGIFPDYTFSLTEAVLNRSLSAPTGLVGQFVRDNPNDDAPLRYTLRYVVTALDADGVESAASNAAAISGKYPTDWVIGNHVSLSWEAVPGAVEYNIYRDSGGYYGLIGITDTISFMDQNYEADVKITPKKDWDPFANGNYPATVCFHQQRLVLAGTKFSPATVYMSRTGEFESFRKSRPLQDDDPVEYMLASGSIDEIRWAISFGNLLIGTSGSEATATSGGAAITPSDVQISAHSYWGSAHLQPVIIGACVAHLKRGGSHVMGLRYSLEADNYTSDDLSLLAPHLVEARTIRQWCFQQDPAQILWMVCSDGQMLALTWLREQNVYAWSRHSCLGAEGQARFLSAIVLSGRSYNQAKNNKASKEEELPLEPQVSLKSEINLSVHTIFALKLSDAESNVFGNIFPVRYSIQASEQKINGSIRAQTKDFEGSVPKNYDTGPFRYVGSGKSHKLSILSPGTFIYWSIVFSDPVGVFDLGFLGVSGSASEKTIRGYYLALPGDKAGINALAYTNAWEDLSFMEEYRAAKKADPKCTPFVFRLKYVGDIKGGSFGRALSTAVRDDGSLAEGVQSQAHLRQTTARYETGSFGRALSNDNFYVTVTANGGDALYEGEEKEAARKAEVPGSGEAQLSIILEKSKDLILSSTSIPALDGSGKINWQKKPFVLGPSAAEWYLIPGAINGLWAVDSLSVPPNIQEKTLNPDNYYHFIMSVPENDPCAHGFAVSVYKDGLGPFWTRGDTGGEAPHVNQGKDGLGPFWTRGDTGGESPHVNQGKDGLGPSYVSQLTPEDALNTSLAVLSTRDVYLSFSLNFYEAKVCIAGAKLPFKLTIDKTVYAGEIAGVSEAQNGAGTRYQGLLNLPAVLTGTKRINWKLLVTHPVHGELIWSGILDVPVHDLLAGQNVRNLSFFFGEL